MRTNHGQFCACDGIMRQELLHGSLERLALAPVSSRCEFHAQIRSLMCHYLRGQLNQRFFGASCAETVGDGVKALVGLLVRGLKLISVAELSCLTRCLKQGPQELRKRRGRRRIMSATRLASPGVGEVGAAPSAILRRICWICRFSAEDSGRRPDRLLEGTQHRANPRVVPNPSPGRKRSAEQWWAGNAWWTRRRRPAARKGAAIRQWRQGVTACRSEPLQDGPRGRSPGPQRNANKST